MPKSFKKRFIAINGYNKGNRFRGIAFIEPKENKTFE